MALPRQESDTDLSNLHWDQIVKIIEKSKAEFKKLHAECKNPSKDKIKQSEYLSKLKTNAGQSLEDWWNFVETALLKVGAEELVTPDAKENKEQMAYLLAQQNEINEHRSDLSLLLHDVDLTDDFKSAEPTHVPMTSEQTNFSLYSLFSYCFGKSRHSKNEETAPLTATNITSHSIR